jgi:hypothetical protein
MTTDATRPFNQTATQSERERILRNDQRVRSGSTYLDHTHDDEGGRFAKPRTVIGSDDTAQYPMAAPNWSADPCGVEPPLGVAIDAHEPVGEVFEVVKSLDDTAATNIADVVASPCGEVAVSSSDLAGANSAASVALRSDVVAPEAVSATPSDAALVEPPVISNTPKPRSL